MISIRHIFRNKLVLVAAHVAAWTCLFLFPFFIYRIRVEDHSFYLKEAINTLFIIGLFYLNIYVLIPRFFTLKRIGIYIGFVMLSLLFIGAQQALVEYQFMKRIMAFKMGAVGMAVTGPGMMLPARGKMLITGGAIMDDDQGPELHIAQFARPSPGWRRRAILDYRNSRPVIATVGMDSMATMTATMAAPATPFGDRLFIRHFFFPEIFRKSATFTLLMLFMSGFIKIGLEWFKSEKQREELKLANLNAELKFLKSQINPHFLFNSLNTIYSLAHRRSPETEHALVKLSNILRYMIYQSNEDKVQLSSELRYLQDYIDIQRLRMTRNIPVEFSQDGDASGLEIAPMLLIPFVENAFKHGVSYREEAFINIRLHIEPGGILHLVVRNRLFKQRVAEKGGVGLNNALKRLSLLYHDAHTITVREHGDEYIADLKIALKHDEVLSVG
ncbi:histidine kinase [Chitinophaga barathri]|uniref:Signal transduction histidine kinase internal region domain-containing protein n=1 Tax=Chitinophaga barathri TaxID=1647451 RepID=A0A3N4MFZ9_9BACT|nr:histidine kinase [Chitinophaga barathri]RPD40926.1 hypothetical protein EG028_12995 [Chitinophaga barathri]